MQIMTRKDVLELSRGNFLKMSAVGMGTAAMGALGLKEAVAQSITTNWEKETDVVIVGSGFSGLAAAIEAHDAGASVIILEKKPVHGGNSIISGGIYNAFDPERQQAQGINDSLDLHFEQTLAAGDFRGDPDRVRFIVENALEGWQWLEKMGVQLKGPILQIFGAIWPRCHRPQYKGKKAGPAIVAALYDQVRSRGIPLLLEHKVTRIIRSQCLDGRVLGAQADVDGKQMNFKARKAVILASGGFCANVQMRMKHDPRFDERFGTTNHAGATGETLMMAADVGADIVGIDFIQSTGPTGPDVRYVKAPAGFAPFFRSPMFVVGRLSVDKGIYTDLRGKRIAAADARRDYITEATMRTPEKVCVGIYDAVSIAESLKPGDSTTIRQKEEMLEKRPQETFRADTLRELAQKVGMPDPKVLEETVVKYNSYVDAKHDPEFGQLPINLTWKCQKPPYWAATGSPALHYMCGGVRTKARSPEVLDRWGRVIEGLYAAGEITGGMHGTNRVGGNATPDCIVFGRLAGKIAVAQKPWG